MAVAPSLNQASQNTQARNHSEEVSVAKAVGSIVFAFTICWIPSFTSSGEIILWDLFEKKHLDGSDMLRVPLIDLKKYAPLVSDKEG